jgi:ABC-type uncharacterized transport system ATPase subunit
MTESNLSRELAPPPPAVELIDIVKAYPGVLANDRISLSVTRGEVHCLLGENGAGKSTLMSILAGMVQPDAGQIRLEGRHVEIASPKRAIALGIGMVYQHTTLVPTLTVLENLMLGTGDGVRLETRVAGQRLQELWRGSKVLILDEPTSMLTPQGVAELAKVLERLKGQGLAVVFITHKLHEAISMGDRVTILKLGRKVGTIEPEEIRERTHEELQARIVALMFGEEPAQAADVPELLDVVEGHRTRRDLPTEPALELDAVTVEPRPGEIGVRDVSLDVRPGEILGVAGVDGNGQRELAEAIAGQRPVAGGDIRFGGLSIKRLKVGQREKLGLRYVTDDRLGEGTVAPLSVALNLVLKRIGQAPFWRGGRIRRAEIEREARTLVDRFDVRTPGINARVGTLSGGNIQKVVLARELSFDPKIVLYNKPTYGLDIRTTQTVRARIRDQAEHGVTSVLISTDLEELLDLCDRIAVLSRGRVAGVVDNGPNAARDVGELMVGGTA